MKAASISLAVLMAAATAHADNRALETAEAPIAAESGSSLAGALKEAKVSLAGGLEASKKEGTPISGKFELEDGKP